MPDYQPQPTHQASERNALEYLPFRNRQPTPDERRVIRGLAKPAALNVRIRKAAVTLVLSGVAVVGTVFFFAGPALFVSWLPTRSLRARSYRVRQSPAGFLTELLFYFVLLAAFSVSSWFSGQTPWWPLFAASSMLCASWLMSPLLFSQLECHLPGRGKVSASVRRWQKVSRAERIGLVLGRLVPPLAVLAGLRVLREFHVGFGYTWMLIWGVALLFFLLQAVFWDSAVHVYDAVDQKDSSNSTNPRFGGAAAPGLALVLLLAVAGLTQLVGVRADVDPRVGITAAFAVIGLVAALRAFADAFRQLGKLSGVFSQGRILEGYLDFPRRAASSEDGDAGGNTGEVHKTAAQTETDAKRRKPKALRLKVTPRALGYDFSPEVRLVGDACFVVMEAGVEVGRLDLPAAGALVFADDLEDLLAQPVCATGSFTMAESGFRAVLMNEWPADALLMSGSKDTALLRERARLLARAVLPATLAGAFAYCAALFILQECFRQYWF